MMAALVGGDEFLWVNNYYLPVGRESFITVWLYNCAQNTAPPPSTPNIQSSSQSLKYGRASDAGTWQITQPPQIYLERDQISRLGLLFAWFRQVGRNSTRTSSHAVAGGSGSSFGDKSRLRLWGLPRNARLRLHRMSHLRACQQHGVGARCFGWAKTNISPVSLATPPALLQSPKPVNIFARLFSDCRACHSSVTIGIRNTFGDPMKITKRVWSPSLAIRLL